MRKLFQAALAASLLAGTAAIAQPAAEPPGAELLPAGEGRALVVQTCSMCHSLEVVSQQRLDANGWADLVQMMRDRGAQGSDDDMAHIVTYLAGAFPAAGPAAAAPAASTATAAAAAAAPAHSAH